MPFAFCTLKFKIDSCHSLKQKRSILAAITNRVKKLNISMIESALHDKHEESEVQIVLIRSTEAFLNQELNDLLEMFEIEFPNLTLFAFEKEFYI